MPSVNRYSNQAVFGRRLSRFLLVVLLGLSLLYVVTSAYPNGEARRHADLLIIASHAMQQSIIFAHLQYQIKANGKGPKNDLITVANEALDFNSFGFPFATSASLEALHLPPTRLHCREIWTALLPPMSGYIAPNEKPMIRVEVIESECIYQSIKFDYMNIRYDPTRGQVSVRIDN